MNQSRKIYSLPVLEVGDGDASEYAQLFHEVKGETLFAIS